MGSLEELILRGKEAGDPGQGLLSAPEAERIVDQLCTLNLEEVGGERFLTQHGWIEKLNLQAHHNAQTHSDEFVMELLVSYDKLDILVHNLLVIEAWKEHAFPLLEEHLASNVDGVLSYLPLFHEAAITNLLEVLMFHRHVCEALSEEALVELADWAYRKLSWLNTGEAHAAAQPPERGAQELLAMAPLQELREKRLEVEWGVALCALTILRYLTDRASALPLGLLARLAGGHDTLMALVPLADRPPWVRMRRGKEERYEGGRWQAVAPADRLRLGQHDAQVWLALCNLLLDPRCRAKMDLDSYRRDALARLRPHLHELLLDQLPVARDLARALDALTLGADTGASDQQQRAARLIIEQVPVMRQAIVRGVDWRALAARQRDTVFGRDAKRVAKERLDAMLQTVEFLASIEQQGAQLGGLGSEEGTTEPLQQQPVKVGCWRKGREGAHEWWSDYELRIAADRPPERVEVAAEGGAKVTGMRWRLQPLELTATRALASTGKVVVRHAGRTAEALLRLPVVSLRSGDDGPPALWLTVGLLATDGFALQLKLRKADKATERDKVEGVWHAYHPVGGAMTLLEKR